MKQFKVNKAFNPKSKSSILVKEGTYCISDWGVDGFTVDTVDGKVFISSGEVAPFGKVIAKIVVPKN